MKHRVFVVAACACLMGVLLQAAADTVTDRRRLSEMPGVFPATHEDIAAEIHFGRNVAARILARYPIYGSDDLNRYLNLVGHALAQNAGRPELTFHFAVVETDAVNAYAAPGGYIFVTRGALLAMQDEAELAAVLAHEIAHVTQKHIVHTMNIGGGDANAGLASIFSSVSDPLRVAFDTAVDKAMSILFEEGLDQQDEFEADRVALELLALTGYDPRALDDYLSKLGERSDMPQTITDTHPGFNLRLASLREAAAPMKLGSVGQARLTERFVSHVQP